MRGVLASGLSKGAGLTIKGANRIIDSSTIGKALKKEVLYRQLDIDTNDLSKREQEALNDYLDETGTDGVWLANKYGDEFREMLKPSCRVGSLGTGSFGGSSLGSDRFHSVGGPQATLSAGSCDPDIDGLDADGARRIRKLQNRGVLDDDDVRQLLRVIDEGGDIESGDVRVALKRVEGVDDQGHEVVGFRTADDANSMPDHDGDQPPHKSGTIVVEAEIESKDRFVRLYESGDSKAGRWMMRESEFAGLNDPADALDRFALSKEWKDYDSVAEIELEGDANLGV